MQIYVIGRNKMQKFNVMLEETLKKVTNVVVEARDEDELVEILEVADAEAEDCGFDSEDYISELKKHLKVIEVIESDEEMEEFECTDYYKERDKDAQN